MLIYLPQKCPSPHKSVDRDGPAPDPSSYDTGSQISKIWILIDRTPSICASAIHLS